MPEVRQLIRDEIGKCNASLPPAARMRRFLLLNKELEADDIEITRTRKIRRRYVAEKYKAVVDALYGGQSDVELHRRHHLRGRAQIDDPLERRDREFRHGAAGADGAGACLTSTGSSRCCWSPAG